MALVQIQLVQENNGFLHRTLRFRFKIYGVLHRALRGLGGVKLVGNSGGICSTRTAEYRYCMYMAVLRSSEVYRYASAVYSCTTGILYMYIPR